MKKRVFSILVCMVLIVALLAGCSTDKDPADVDNGNNVDSGTGSNKDTEARTDLVFGITSEPKSLTPYKMDEFTGFGMSYQLYDPLIELKADGTMVPALATSWEYENDGKDIVFNLREGVKFHNGTEMTAEDVAYSFNQAIATPTTSNTTATFEKMEIIDDYTVRLVQKHVFGPVESVMPFAHLRIVSKEADEADPDAFSREPVGTGPYKFASWKAGDKIVFEAFDDYWQGEPVIKELVYKVSLDVNTTIVAMENGEIDICDTIPNSQKQTIDNNDSLIWASAPAQATYFLQLNTSNEPFDNELVRQAIAHAIDKESLVIGALEGNGAPIEAMMSPSVKHYPETFKSKFQYDPERSKELLKEAGYPDGFSVVYTVMDDSRFIPPSEMIQEMLRQVGIDAEFDKLERSVWLEQVRNTHNYDMTFMNTSPVYPDADYLFALYHSDFISTMKNWGEVDNAELDALLEAGRTSVDEAERKEIYEKVVKNMDDHMFAPPLYVPDQPVVYHKDLNGIIPNGLRRFFVFELSW